MKKIIKNPIFTFVLGVLFTSSVVYAYVFKAQDIDFDNTASNILDSSDQPITNVQDAIDTLYDMANNKQLSFSYVYSSMNASNYTISSDGDYIVCGARGATDLTLSVNGQNKGVTAYSQTKSSEGNYASFYYLPNLKSGDRISWYNNGLLIKINH